MSWHLSPHSTKQEKGLVMIMTLDSADVEPRITAPATKEFPGLPRKRPHRFGKIHWFSMKELDQTLLSILNKQHCPPIGINSPVEYGSFELKTLSANIPETFPWIEHSPKQKVLMKFSSSVQECPFRITENFYVPARWGTKVIRLVENGIVRLNTHRRQNPLGICWDGTEIDSGTMMECLFKT